MTLMMNTSSYCIRAAGATNAERFNIFHLLNLKAREGNSQRSPSCGSNEEDSLFLIPQKDG